MYWKMFEPDEINYENIIPNHVFWIISYKVLPYSNMLTEPMYLGYFLYKFASP